MNKLYKLDKYEEIKVIAEKNICENNGCIPASIQWSELKGYIKLDIDFNEFQVAD